MGVLLKQEVPFAYVVKQEQSRNICGRCLKIVQRLKRCSNCLSSYYCGTNCQKADWNTHKSECGFLKRSLHNNPSVIQQCRLLLKIIRRSEKPVHPAFNGRTLNDLISNSLLQKSRPSTRAAFSLILETLKNTDHFKNFPPPDELFEIFCKTITNCIHIMTDEGVCIGVGLYIGLSELNHSCDPDAYYLFDGPVISLRALKDDITTYSSKLRIPYTDLLQFNSVRQQILNEQYCFTCDCRVCNDEQRDNEGRSLRCLYCSDGYCPLKCDGTVSRCAKCNKQSSHNTAEALKLMHKMELLNKDYAANLTIKESDATALYEKGKEMLAEINIPLFNLGMQLLQLAIEKDDYKRGAYYIEKILHCLRHFLPPGFPTISEKCFYAGKLHSLYDESLSLSEQRFTEALIYLFDICIRKVDLLKISHGPNNPKIVEATETLMKIRLHKLSFLNERKS